MGSGVVAAQHAPPLWETSGDALIWNLHPYGVTASGQHLMKQKLSEQLLASPRLCKEGKLSGACLCCIPVDAIRCCKFIFSKVESAHTLKSSRR